MSDDDSLNLLAADAKRADAVKNHARLLDTARQLFDEQGVANISMTQIAQSAGVGKGTLYRHFRNKTELCYALLDQEQRQLQEATFERLRQGSPPVDDLRWFVDQAADFVLRNVGFLHSGVEAGEAASVEMAAHAWWRQTIRGLLLRAKVSGDVEYLSDTLYMMLNVETLHFQSARLGYPAERIHAGLQLLVTRVVG